MPRTKFTVSQSDSTEDTAGNMPPVRRSVDEGEPQGTEDTAGHMPPLRKRIDEGEPQDADDTEGQGVRGK